MEICKAKSKKDFIILSMLLEEYIVELHNISWTVQIRPWKILAKEYFNVPDTDYWLLKEENKIIGFAIVGYNTNCPIWADKYIEEFYIVPECRKKHYGKKFINKILKDSDSVYLAILKTNNIGRKFWSNIFKDWMLKDVVDDYDVFFYTFSREKY